MRCLIAITQLSLSLTAPHDANYVVSPCLVAVGPYVGLQGVCSLWFPQHLAQGDSQQMWERESCQDFYSHGSPGCCLVET